MGNKPQDAKNVHSFQSPGNEIAQIFRCLYCQAAYSTSRELQAHRRLSARRPDHRPRVMREAVHGLLSHFPNMLYEEAVAIVRDRKIPEGCWMVCGSPKPDRLDGPSRFQNAFRDLARFLHGFVNNPETQPETIGGSYLRLTLIGHLRFGPNDVDAARDFLDGFKWVIPGVLWPHAKSELARRAELATEYGAHANAKELLACARSTAFRLALREPVPEAPLTELHSKVAALVQAHLLEDLLGPKYWRDARGVEELQPAEAFEGLAEEELADRWAAYRIARRVEEGDAFQRLEAEETARLVEEIEARANLTAAEAEVWHLHHREGLEPNHIAQRLGKAAGTVRKQLHDARKKLRAVLPARLATPA